jgi:hypothetical protein
MLGFEFTNAGTGNLSIDVKTSGQVTDTVIRYFMLWTVFDYMGSEVGARGAKELAITVYKAAMERYTIYQVKKTPFRTYHGGKYPGFSERRGQNR